MLKNELVHNCYCSKQNVQKLIDDFVSARIPLQNDFQLQSQIIPWNVFHDDKTMASTDDWCTNFATFLNSRKSIKQYNSTIVTS